MVDAGSLVVGEPEFGHDECYKRQSDEEYNKAGRQYEAKNPGSLFEPFYMFDVAENADPRPRQSHP